MPDPLARFEAHDDFLTRHLGSSPDEQAEMLAGLGFADLDELIAAAVPAPLLDDHVPDLPPARSEAAVLARLRELAAANDVRRAFIGLGYHGTVTPAVLRRGILEDPGWYTAYTPYQPEISQGRLEALLTFQTMVTDLTGTELAGASLLDEATAAAEGLALSRRVSRRQLDPAAGREALVLDHRVHPQTLAVVRTRGHAVGLEVVVTDLRDPAARAAAPLARCRAVLLQSPDTDGVLHDDRALIAELHDLGLEVVVAADLLACTVVVPPGEQGADVVVGSSQRFGVPLFAGGPHAAFLGTRAASARQYPGRLVGVSVDARGRPAYRLALQTREQHIRRDRATSNICTSQVLLAVLAAMYAVHHGPDGLRGIALRTHALTGALRAGLAGSGIEVVGEHHLDTLTLQVPGRAELLRAAAADAGYELGRVPGPDGRLRPADPDHLRIALDETATRDDVVALLRVLTGIEVGPEMVGASTAARAVAAHVELAEVEGLETAARRAPLPGIPAELTRTSPMLTDARFHRYRSETALRRWLRELRDRDIALDRAMIPLGSCTMKLNAAVQLEPVSWPGFADLHPFAPAERLAGTRRLVADLERWLAELTGYDAVSLQPNAGAQGELAGLLAIRGYHRARGQHQRDVCLVPASAHGTNAASAVMAGLEVVVVACDERGDVDLADLTRLVEEHHDRLAALMVTYPSTHGVYEAGITEVCELVHAHGGQVYLDGANLNALVGIARPGRFGADVSHLNLHKTFAIPHGGGGPGVGPVACLAHLAPYLPSHPLVPEAAHDATRLLGDEQATGPVSAAPWGSAGVLQIAWAYLALLGGPGVASATRTAILHANHVARRLAGSFPVLYTGPGGLVAHEAVLDVRPFRTRAGITNEDVAKRLIDHGFHAPTMSFPVPGTLMVEPTESESLAELERFCAAMLAIRAEIAEVERGTWPRDDNPLVNAPHPEAELTADDWPHPYPRSRAAHPMGQAVPGAYRPPVARVDNVHGDRNLQCACPAPAAYEQAR